MKLHGLDLFTGIGGVTLALQEYVEPLAYCENEPYAQSTILQNMQKGLLPKAPIWDDIRTLSTKEWDMQPDIVYGGSPCQDISIAGAQRGLAGKRSGLIFEVLRLLDETKAPFLFLENVPNIRTKGAERICKELAERRYDSRWCCISASDLGAPHKRERWFLLAHSPSSITNSPNERTRFTVRGQKTQSSNCVDSKRTYWQTVECPVCGMDDGISHRMDRIKCLGNAVVPIQVKTAFQMLLGI